MNRREFFGTLGALPVIPALTSAVNQPVESWPDGLTADEAGHIVASAVMALGLRELRMDVKREGRPWSRGYPWCGQTNLGMESPHPDRLHRKTLERLTQYLIERIQRTEANQWARLLVPHGVLRAGYIGPVRVVQVHEILYDRNLTRFDVGLLRNGEPVGTGSALEIVSHVWDE